MLLAIQVILNTVPYCTARLGGQATYYETWAKMEGVDISHQALELTKPGTVLLIDFLFEI